MTDRPIFVVGAPRTGTTLLMEILNRHPEIHLFDEVHFFERIWDERREIGDLTDPDSRGRAFARLRAIVRDWGRDQAVAGVLDDAEFTRRLAAEGGGYRGLMAALMKAGAELHGATRWGDSSPQDVLYAEQILAWFPEARIIGIVRDPRGFLASYKNYWRRGVASYRERYQPLANALLWKSYMRALLRLASGERRDAVLVIRYEDLVSDPEAHVRRFCEHLGVDFTAAMLEVDATNTSFPGEPAKGIVATSRDRWRSELTATEIRLGERVFGATMRELGYEPIGKEAGRISVRELLHMLAVLPARLFHTLIGTGKPLTLAKVKKVLSSLWA
jgi:hypothetical protein